MKEFQAILTAFDDWLWGNWLLFVLLGVGILYTVITGGIQIRRFGYIIRKTVWEPIRSKNKESKESGTISSFQALCTAVASCVGSGNIVGVSTAVLAGGMGAIFWMWIAAFFGMATIFAEAVLAQTYKTTDDQGHVTGGPAYYISKGLGSKKLAAFFSISIIIALGFIGNMVQSNSIADAFQTAFSLPPLLIGVIISALAAFVFFGGMGRIAAFTEKVVPIMAALYLLGGLIVLLANASHIIPALKMVFVGAFDPAAATGGIIGAGVKEAMRYGVARGLFSNEAGMGSAPNAAAAADVSHPVKQGLVQMLSVFIDTILICSTTAFMLLLSGVPIDAYSEGMNFVQAAVHSQVGPFGPLFITVSIFLFAFSSLVGNYYYTESNFRFIRDSKTGLLVFRLTCVAAIFIGAQMSFSMVWDLADVLMGLMALVNLVAILLLGGKAIRVLRDYQKQRRAGKNPVYRYDEVGVGSPEIWNEAHAKKWED